MPASTFHIADTPSRLAPAPRRPAALPTILDELFRIACEADAYEIHVETFDYESRPTLSVYDNGSGIESPLCLALLGALRSRHELADGIDFSSLSGRHTIIRSGPEETEPGWSLTISPEAWRGQASITIEPDGGLRGTNILIEIPDAWRAGLEEAVATAAEHVPPHVFFHARWKNRP